MVKKVILIFSVFLTLLMGSACSAKGDLVTERDSLDGNGIKTVSVNYRSVHLTVEKGTSNQLEVELDTYERGPELSVNKNGDHVDIVAEGGVFQLGFIKIGGFSRKSPMMTIKVPENYRKNLNFEGTAGNVKLRNLNLNEVRFSTKSSHVDGAGITARRINGNSASGNISISFEKFATEMNLSSASGNIRLELNDKHPDVTLETTTASGSREIDFPIKGSKNSEGFSGTIGKGTHKVRLKTSSGSISLTP